MLNCLSCFFLKRGPENAKQKQVEEESYSHNGAKHFRAATGPSCTDSAPSNMNRIKPRRISTVPHAVTYFLIGQGVPKWKTPVASPDFETGPTLPILHFLPVYICSPIPRYITPRVDLFPEIRITLLGDRQWNEFRIGLPLSEPKWWPQGFRGGNCWISVYPSAVDTPSLAWLKASDRVYTPHADDLTPGGESLASITVCIPVNQRQSAFECVVYRWSQHGDRKSPHSS